MRENKKRGALYGHFTPRRFARLGLVCVAPPEQKKKVRKETADEIFDFIQGRKVGGKKKHRRIAATKKTGVAVRSCHFEGDAMLDSDNNKKKPLPVPSSRFNGDAIQIFFTRPSAVTRTLGPFGQRR